ncbi:MAG: hypothetical protein ILP02_01325, partial [Clostridia bacterium]|nr:hypothetical protein [Clostridia bacterium]
DGVLIAGGKMDSGARHTATFAVVGGKDVFAFPYSIGVKMGELNTHLIKSGAYLCDDVADILSYLDLSAQKQEETQLDETQSLILGLIKSGVDSVDMLVENTGLKAFELAPHLAEMEVSGLIVKLAGNTYKAKK